jgi:hypothetical protein
MADGKTLLGGYVWGDGRVHGFSMDRIDRSPVTGVLTDGVTLCGIVKAHPYRNPIRSFEGGHALACPDCRNAAIAIIPAWGRQ